MKSLTLKKPKGKVRYSCFIPFSRPWMVDRWFKRFDKMELPRSEAELVVYIDHFSENLFNKIRGLLYIHEMGWKAIYLHFTGRTTTPEYLGRPRRVRHVIMRTDSQELLGDTEYLIGLEDDTLCPVDAFPKLFKILTSDKKIGFVQGTEMDRWGVGCLGAFKMTFDEERGEFISQESLKYQKEGLVEIDAGGHYCFVMPTKLYKQVPFKRGPGFLTNVDIYWLWRVKQLGWKLYNSFDVVCEHHTRSAVFIPAYYCPVMKRYLENGVWYVDITKDGWTSRKKID